MVAGIRNPQDLGDLAQRMPEVHAELLEILGRLERHYGDMQDVEFTVEEGRLFLLQTRNAKRPAQAAVRFALDAVARGAARPRGGAADDRRRLARRAAAPGLRPRFEYQLLTRGVAASPGAAKGRDRLSAPPTRSAARPTART